MSLKAWRVFHKAYVDDPVCGIGAAIVGGRWNSPGIPVVYASKTLALAQLEHRLDPDEPNVLKLYRQVVLEFDDDLVEHLDPEDLPADWDAVRPNPSTQKIGDTWYKKKESAVLSVPSAVDPSECNYVINPNHPDFTRISVSEPEPLIAD